MPKIFAKCSCGPDCSCKGQCGEESCQCAEASKEHIDAPADTSMLTPATQYMYSYPNERMNNKSYASLSKRNVKWQN